MSSISMLVLLLTVGLLLSLNPFNLSVFSVLLAGTLGKGHPKAKVHNVASTYLIVYWLATALLGIALVLILGHLPDKTLQTSALIISGLMILWGTISLKNYFWPRLHFKVPAVWHDLLHKHTVKRHSTNSALILSLSAYLISLGGIGLQLLALATIIALLTPEVPQWMLLPASCLVLPLIFIYQQILKGFRVSALLKWKSDSGAMMRLSLSLVQIVLGWLILLILNGSIGVMP
jgi:hypothetical protein